MGIESIESAFYCIVISPLPILVMPPENTCTKPGAPFQGVQEMEGEDPSAMGRGG